MVSKYFFITLLLTVLLQEKAAASLHKEYKIMQRIARQAGRYGTASNYQSGQVGAYAVRGGGANVGTPGGSNISGKGQAVFKTAARPVGTGAYNFGGVANGRQPAYGPNFALSSAGRQPSLGSVYGGQVQGGARPQANAVYRGTAGRPGPGSYQG